MLAASEDDLWSRSVRSSILDLAVVWLGGMLLAHAAYEAWDGRLLGAKQSLGFGAAGLGALVCWALTATALLPHVRRGLLVLSAVAFACAALCSLSLSCTVKRLGRKGKDNVEKRHGVLYVALSPLFFAAAMCALALGCGTAAFQGFLPPSDTTAAILRRLELVPMLQLAGVLLLGVLPLLSWEACETHGDSCARGHACASKLPALERILEDLEAIPSCLCVGPISIPSLAGGWLFSGRPSTAAFLIAFAEASNGHRERPSPPVKPEGPAVPGHLPVRTSISQPQPVTQQKGTPRRIMSVDFVGGKVMSRPLARQSSANHGRPSVLSNASDAAAGDGADASQGSNASSLQAQVAPMQTVRHRHGSRKGAAGLKEPTAGLIGSPFTPQGRLSIGERAAARVEGRPPEIHGGEARSNLSAQVWGQSDSVARRSGAGTATNSSLNSPRNSMDFASSSGRSGFRQGLKPNKDEEPAAVPASAASPSPDTTGHSAAAAAPAPTATAPSVPTPSPAAAAPSAPAPVAAATGALSPPSVGGGPTPSTSSVFSASLADLARSERSAPGGASGAGGDPGGDAGRDTSSAGRRGGPPPPPPSDAARADDGGSGGGDPPSFSCSTEAFASGGDPHGVWVDPEVLAVLMRLRKMASGLAHDMKNPLTCVLSLAGMLSQDESLPMAVRNHLKVMLVCSTHLLVMISNLRDNLWLLTGSLDLNPAQVAVLPIINQTLSNVASIVRPAVKVIVDSDDTHECCFDDERLKRIIHVLLANAVKYTSKGSITVSTSIVNEMLELKFQDTGSGVDAATCKAFESPDSPLHPQNDPFSKMGLGLRYVARMLRMFKSTISVVNNGKARNSGCTITVRLGMQHVQPQFKPTIELPSGLVSTADADMDEITAALRRAPTAPHRAPPNRLQSVSFSLGVPNASRPPRALPAPPPDAAAAAGAASAAPTTAPEPRPAAEQASPDRAGSALAPAWSFKRPGEVGEPSTVMQRLRSRPPVEPMLSPEMVERLDVIVQRSQRRSRGPTTDAERREAVAEAYAVASEEGPAAEDRVLASPALEQPSQGFNYKAFTIMVVDDDPANLSMLQMLLEGQGYHTTTASSGFEALELFAESMPKPSCVLLDVTLPDISGHEVCAKLGQMTPGLPVPVIMISGKNEKKDIIRGLEKGALDYITKPFQSDEVLARVETILRFHNADVQHVRAGAKQVMEMIRLIFPRHVAELLQNGQRMVAESFESVCVMVIEVVDFTRLCGAVPMASVVENVNRLFCAFDNLMAQHSVEKLDVFGHTYLAYRALEPAKGAEDSIAQQIQQFVDVARMALKITSEIHVGGFLQMQVRIGIHVGPAVAAVLCTRRPKYTMFGTALKAATALQQAAYPSSIVCSAEVASQLLSLEQADGAIFQRPAIEIPDLGFITPFVVKTSDHESALLRHTSSVMSVSGDRRVLRAVPQARAGPSSIPTRDSMFATLDQMPAAFEAHSGGAGPSYPTGAVPVMMRADEQASSRLSPFASSSLHAAERRRAFGQSSSPGTSSAAPGTESDLPEPLIGSSPFPSMERQGSYRSAPDGTPPTVPEEPSPPWPTDALGAALEQRPALMHPPLRPSPLGPRMPPPPSQHPPPNPPEPPTSASGTAELEQVLAPAGLQHYVAGFAQRGVSVDYLRALDAAQLHRVGVVGAMSRARLYQALHGREPPAALGSPPHAGTAQEDAELLNLSMGSSQIESC